MQSKSPVSGNSPLVFCSLKSTNKVHLFILGNDHVILVLSVNVVFIHALLLYISLLGVLRPVHGTCIGLL